jgi:hypothetical protein
MDLSIWQDTFKSWPTLISGWRDWFRRMDSSQRTFWDEADIGQCLDLSLADMPKNEPMLQMASYFWSDTLNAFIFGNGL